MEGQYLSAKFLRLPKIYMNSDTKSIQSKIFFCEVVQMSIIVQTIEHHPNFKSIFSQKNHTWIVKQITVELF